MTPTYGVLDLADYTERTTKASGVPHYLQDEPTMTRLAVAFAPRRKAAPASTATASHLPKERTND